MKLMDAIYSRRSVRHYKDKQVSKELLDKLIDAAVQAPSATNSQPWAFAVIQDKAQLKAYSDRTKLHLLEAAKRHAYLEKYQPMLSNQDFNIFYNASTLLIIYAKPEGPHPEGDCCLAAQNLMLAAHDMGLGTCWIGFAVAFLSLPEVKAELGVPKDYIPVAPLIVGYPEGRIPQLMRKEPEIVFWR